MIPPGVSPIPSHLLSSALTQRHNLLQLEPTDPAYYAWPVTDGLEATHSPDPAQVVQALESLNESSALGLEALQDLSFPIRYAPSPPGAPKALVHVPLPGKYHNAQQLVLVFAWDETEGEDDGAWKFHDMRLFLGGHDPADAGFATLDDAMAISAPDADADDSPDSLNSGSSDAYWNGYTASNGSGRATSYSPTTGEGDDEDAYWARYEQTSMSVSPAPPPKTNGVVNGTGRPTVSPSAALARLEAVAAAQQDQLTSSPITHLRPLQSQSHSRTRTPSPHVPPLITSSPPSAHPEIDLSSPLVQPRNLSPQNLASPCLPPAPSGTTPLTLLPSPTQPSSSHLHHHASTPLGLTLNLGTPPPSLPTVSAPLPTSPSIVQHPVVLVDVKGKGRAHISTARDSAEGCALAINLNPSSAGGSEPLSALSMSSAASRQSSLSQLLQSGGVGNAHIPSPVSPPPSRANSGSTGNGPASSTSPNSVQYYYPSSAALQRRGSHPLATSHTASSSVSSVSSASASNAEQDAGMGEMVRGMFRMWRASRPAGQPGTEEEFVTFVAGALGRQPGA